MRLDKHVTRFLYQQICYVNSSVKYLKFSLILSHIHTFTQTYTHMYIVSHAYISTYDLFVLQVLKIVLKTFKCVRVCVRVCILKNLHFLTQATSGGISYAKNASMCRLYVCLNYVSTCKCILYK